MRNQKKKTLIALVISLALICSLTACSSTNDTNNNTAIVDTSDKCPASEYGNHKWVSPTCIEPARCFWCDAYKDDKLADHHNWNVYNNGLTQCEDCNILREDWLRQQGLNEQEGIINSATSNETNEDTSNITAVSNETINDDTATTKTEQITSFVLNDYFTISPYAFAKRFEDSSSKLKNIDFSTKADYDEYAFYDDENTIFYRIQDKNNNYKDIGIMSFTKPNGKTVAAMDEFSENCINCINILIEDSYDVSAVVYSSILAIDSDIGYSEAADVGQIIVDNVAIGNIDEEYPATTHNGIKYFLYKDGNYHYLSNRSITTRLQR